MLTVFICAINASISFVRRRTIGGSLRRAIVAGHTRSTDNVFSCSTTVHAYIVSRDRGSYSVGWFVKQGATQNSTST
jgi:hypothetical protein